MNLYCLLIPIILPLVCGAILPLFRFKESKYRQWYTEIVVIINSLIVFWLIAMRPEGSIQALNLAGDLEICFHMDGLSMVFAGLVAALWPFATYYAFEYMKHEGKEDKFFAFYTMTYGVTIGIAFASNLMTLYMFYEMLTLVTLPLVMHSMSKKAILAGRKYVSYSIGGAAFAFVGFIFIFTFGSSMNFEYGGVLSAETISIWGELLRLVYVMAVVGFGVKAAIFPFHGWLPAASVAPTPVTALLHAVAVVKAGAFAIIRITYYSFGTDFLRGTWAQYAVLALAMITIIYGSARAVKEQHFKRRLAYSTVSNLSYIIFGAALMTPAGMTGALSHMIFHAIMKITLFFCAGAVLYKTGREYISELDGLGRKMPFTMTCFAIGSAGVVGVPLLPGFISKWNLATAAVEEGSVVAALGIGALLISAFLTAVYLFSVVSRSFFPSKKFDYSILSDVEEPNHFMKLPLAVFCITMIVFGVYAEPLMQFFGKIAAGLM